mmetsp:Transcript_11446/g.19359  ORF Transcript_11446/g.19359 Transcript_11446/m.19359 type:complete len:92 (+) Transcript_11446:763-1038(+)
MYGLTDVPDCSLAPQRMWVRVELGYYIFNMFFVYSYYKYVAMRNRENHKFLIANCALNVVHTAWLVYGNVLYYKYTAECLKEFSDAKNYQG